MTNSKGPIVLYIAGYGRSGSTLLNRLLGTVDGVHFCGEVFELWKRLLDNKVPCSCGTPATACPFWSAVAVLNKLGLRGMMVRGELAMTKEKRPDRNWKEYNEQLVQRGEILLAVESLSG